MAKRLSLLVLALSLACSVVRAAGDELEAGFRTPPAACQPSPGWFLSKAFADAVAKAPDDLRPAFERALADGGLSTTPEEIKRLAAWQALTDAALIASAGGTGVPPVAQPYAALAKPLHDSLARLVYVCSKSTPVGGVFTQDKPAHGLTLYPPPPEQTLFLARRRLGDADAYLAVSQAQIDTVITITFPGKFGPELWDPEDGSIREASTYWIQDDKQTMLHLRLGPYQALFIVLRKPPSEQHVMMAPTLEITRVAPDGNSLEALARVNGRNSVMFTGQRMKIEIVKDLPPPLPIETGWAMKTLTPAKRAGVGVVELRYKRATLEEEKSAAWAAPDFDDSKWATCEVGKPIPAAAQGGTWQADWLRMRGNNEQRLYRKAFDLPDEPDLATVTITADNGYALFVNGQKVGSDGNWNAAETYDAAKLLHKGRNAFAVRLTNQGDVGALLLEARIRLASGRLVRIVTDESWKMVEKAPEGWEKADFDDKDWGKVDVAGKPPVAPWGDVPGLPPDPTAGESVLYRFKLPGGAKSVAVPAGAKEPRLYVDGKEVPLKDGAADLSADVQSKPRVGALRTIGFAAIEKPILVECSETAVGIGNWLLVGYPTYSGLADYTVELTLPEAYRGERLILDLGQVGCAVQLFVNGKDLGVRLWQPYTFDITDALKAGPNALKLTVADTAANALGKDLPAERLAAGILGPVRVLARRALAIKAE